MARRILRVISTLTLITVTTGVASLRASVSNQTWTGVISDSMCKAHHESGAEGQETTDPECTRDCVTGGSTYVLLVENTVYAIANQDHADLTRHAGTRVIVTGELQGDAIAITAIEKAH